MNSAPGPGPRWTGFPLDTVAVDRHRPEDAADAGGLLVTVTQLGRLIGFAAFGTLFLNRLESCGAPGAYTSSDALLVCVLVLATTAATGTVSGPVRRRR